MTFRNMLVKEKNNQKAKGKIVDLFLYNYLKNLTLWKEKLTNPEIIEDYKELEKTYFNTTEFSRKSIGGLLCPESIADVREIIAAANDMRVSLHSFSTGKNLGFGSKLPVNSSKTILVNLQKMNKIIEVNERFRYCIIQPGVTQKQLANYLKVNYPKLMFPPTGYSGETSIVGNILERGIGIFGHGYNSLLGLEIITGNNKRIKTGFWHYKKHNSECPTSYYKPGIGPDLNGIFTQSNFGIVTSMIIQLEPKRERKIFTLEFDEKYLNEVTETLYFLREQETINDGVTITTMNDPRISSQNKEKENQWFASSNITGNADIMKALEKEIISAFSKINCKLEFFGQNETNVPSTAPYINIIQSISDGEFREHTLETIRKPGIHKLSKGEDIEEDKNLIGCNSTSSAIPFSGEHVVKAIIELDKIAKKINIQPSYNFFGLTRTSLEGFFRVFFNKQDPKEVKRAHLWNKLAHQRLFGMGFYPNRANIEEMENIFPEESEYWATVKNIKNALDPNNIISPGKYCPYA